ncbi:hypothetical protein AUP68_07729 [Ilyonectria robusta]
MTTSQTPTDLRKIIGETLRAFIFAYKDGGEQNDPAIINRDVTADCTRHLLPASLATSLGAPADFVISNDEYQKLFAADLKAGSVQKIVISNLTVDVEARKAAATTVSDMVFKDGETIVMEHSWILDFTEDGSKVKKVIEFCDPTSVHQMLAKVHAGDQEAVLQSEQ